MPEPDLIELFVAPLERLGIRYIVSGSVAAMLYGEPRLTNDIDLILFLRAEDVMRVAEAFPAAEFYLPPSDIIQVEWARTQRGHFNVIHLESGLKADCYLAGQDELHAWAFDRAQQYAAGQLRVTLAPPEYVIVRKLEDWREGGSEKHRRDIRSMLAVSGDRIDRAALDHWIQRRGLASEWSKVTREPGIC
jgi:hypothetical protein